MSTVLSYLGFFVVVNKYQTLAKKYLWVYAFVDKLWFQAI